jgi:hypothetical protein
MHIENGILFKKLDFLFVLRWEGAEALLTGCIHNFLAQRQKQIQFLKCYFLIFLLRITHIGSKSRYPVILRVMQKKPWTLIFNHIISYIISYIVSYHISYHVYHIIYHNIYHVISCHIIYIISYIKSYHIYIIYIITYIISCYIMSHHIYIYIYHYVISYIISYHHIISFHLFNISTLYNVSDSDVQK